MAPSDYASAGPGRLKLKGVKDSKVDKKKKKKSSSKLKDETGAGDGDDSFQDKSVMLKNLEDEDAQLVKEEKSMRSVADRKEVEPGTGPADEEERAIIKTESERKYEEQRRKRVRGNLLSVLRHLSCCLLCPHIADLSFRTTAGGKIKTRRGQNAQRTGRRAESLS